LKTTIKSIESSIAVYDSEGLPEIQPKACCQTMDL
jgi:hypothetical protein